MLLAGGVLLVAAFLAVSGTGQGGQLPPFGQPVLTNAADGLVASGANVATSRELSSRASPASHGLVLPMTTR